MYSIFVWPCDVSIFQMYQNIRDNDICVKSVNTPHNQALVQRLRFIDTICNVLCCCDEVPLIVFPLNRAPCSCPGLWETIVGAFNGDVLVWEKVAKSWEKRALSRWGREGVNHQRTCLWLNTHSCNRNAHTHTTQEKKHALDTEESQKEQHAIVLACDTKRDDS